MAELRHARHRPAPWRAHAARGRLSLSLLFSLLALLAPRLASAQLHWDASAQVGGMKRFLASQPAGVDDAGFGPAAQLSGHVALLPLVHVGGYLAGDISPLPGDPSARNVLAGGARVKGMLPWAHRAFRAWIFAGFGYAGAYAPSYASTFTFVDFAGTSTRRPVRVAGAGGSFFEIPFGLGASYKLFAPWELCAELGARAGFGHGGTLYEAPGPAVTAEGAAPQRALPAGLDRFALGLTVGVLIDL